MRFVVASRVPAHLFVLGCCVVIAFGMAIVESAGASDSPPKLAMTPGSNLHNGESIAISVGQNGYFTPNSRVNILECSDPDGTTANLPVNDSTCDGNTIQPDSVLVGSDGSFQDLSYTIYSLPNPALGEQANSQPICSQSNECVLYIGQNQNDFTAPKEFSAPFTIAPASGSTSTTTLAPTTTTSPSNLQSASASSTSTSTSTTAAAVGQSGTAGDDPAVALAEPSADPSTLPNTGPPAGAAWIVAMGTLLVFLGSLGRHHSARVRP
jgi:LPXTG-motif cell wall-anchored protein